MQMRPETARQEMLRDLLSRNAMRYKAAQARVVFAYSYEEVRAVRQRLRDWFEDWHLAIQLEYANAINADDGIIGKQFHYDVYRKKHALDALNDREFKLP